MSRSGWSTANFLRYASGVVTAAPLSIAFWGYTSITGSSQIGFGLFTSGSAFNRNSFYLRTNTSDQVTAETGAGAASSNAVSSTTITANTWFHACGVIASATSRAAYLNGGGKGTDTTSRTPSGIDRTSIGVGDGSSASTPWAPAGTGYLADVALWNIALSDADVASLALGIHPFLVHPSALVAYWPLMGASSPEPNLKSNTATMAINGSLSQAVNPRLMPMRLAKRVILPAPAATGQPIGKRSGGVEFMGPQFRYSESSVRMW